MSLIRLTNGQKFSIAQPQEGEGMMRNRKRRTLSLTFLAGAEDFDTIRSAFTADNLETITIYYPENETPDEPDERLKGVSHKVFEGYSLLGDWTDKEIETTKETRISAAVYGRQLSVTLGERLMTDT